MDITRWFKNSRFCTGRAGLRFWYGEPLGRRLLEIEQRKLDAILPNLFGYHLLQVGCMVDEDLLGASRISHRIVVDVIDGKPVAAISMQGQPERLPVASDSVDVVVLPHTLEYEADPHQALREVDRILIPEGHVVILGFNPWSFWGLRRLFRRRRCNTYPWCGRFRSLPRIKDWLSLLGFDIVMTSGYFFRPPIQHDAVMRRLRFIETAGARWFSALSGAYMLVAKKRTSTLTPIKPRWRPRRSLIGAEMPEPTTRNGSCLDGDEG